MDTATEELHRPKAGVQESTEQLPPDKTPQEFYAEITKCADVREILEELAAG